MTWGTVFVFLAGALVGWLVTRVMHVVNDRTEASLGRAWDAIAGRLSKRRRARREARQQRKLQEQADHEMKILREERIGQRFRNHVTRDDPGLIGEIVNLGKQRPKAQVVVVWESPDGRAATEDDPTLGRPITMDWSVLTRSPEDQRHWTARNYMKSDRDDDGWIEFEPYV